MSVLPSMEMSVVVVDGDEVAQLLGACQGGGLRGHALLHAAVAEDRVDEVVEDRLTQWGAGIQQPVLAARAIARPTALAKPAPSGPVVVSTPATSPNSG